MCGWKLSGLPGSESRHHRISLPNYLMKWVNTYLLQTVKITKKKVYYQQTKQVKRNKQTSKFKNW